MCLYKLNDQFIALNVNYFIFRSFQAAVRSSRRKRNQYVVDLRDHVFDLKKRKQEAITQNELLKQLTSLWQRLCSEVDSEIQDGVRCQLGFQNAPCVPTFEETELEMENSAAASGGGHYQRKYHQHHSSSSSSRTRNNNSNPTSNDASQDKVMISDEMLLSNILFPPNEFGGPHDRGAMEL